MPTQLEVVETVLDDTFDVDQYLATFKLPVLGDLINLDQWLVWAVRKLDMLGYLEQPDLFFHEFPEFLYMQDAIMEVLYWFGCNPHKTWPNIFFDYIMPFGKIRSVVASDMIRLHFSYERSFYEQQEQYADYLVAFHREFSHIKYEEGDANVVTLKYYDCFDEWFLINFDKDYADFPGNSPLPMLTRIRMFLEESEYYKPLYNTLFNGIRGKEDYKSQAEVYGIFYTLPVKCLIVSDDPFLNKERVPSRHKVELKIEGNKIKAHMEKIQQPDMTPRGRNERMIATLLAMGAKIDPNNCQHDYQPDPELGHYGHGYIMCVHCEDVMQIIDS